MSRDGLAEGPLNKWFEHMRLDEHSLVSANMKSLVGIGGSETENMVRVVST